MQTKFKQAKYVSVLKGAILDVVLDLRKGSKTFGKHFKIVLSADNNKSVFLPAGFAHGFLSLKKENIVNYNITNYRSAKHEVSLVWNDKDLKINVYTGNNFDTSEPLRIKNCKIYNSDKVYFIE